MRWRGGLGSFILRDCSLTSCNLSLCSCDVGLCAVPLFLIRNLSLYSRRFSCHTVPSFTVSAVGLRGGCCCRCGVPWWRFVFLFCLPYPPGFEFRTYPSLFVASQLVPAVGLSLLDDPPRVPRACLLGSSLTPPCTASGHNVAFRLFHIPTVAAMRWRGGLGRRLLEGPQHRIYPGLIPCSLCFEPFEHIHIHTQRNRSLGGNRL
jgi:hypothetical protein